MRKCVHWKSYKLLFLTHQSQIKLITRIPLLKRVWDKPYPLKLCIRQRVCFCSVLWEAYLLTSNWVYLNLYSTSWFWILVLQIHLLETLAIWSWLWVSWRSCVKIHHQILSWLLRQRRYDYKNHLKDFHLKKTCRAWNVLGVCDMIYSVEFI